MQELQALVRGASQLAGSEGPDQQVLHVLQKSTSTSTNFFSQNILKTFSKYSFSILFEKTIGSV